MKTRTYQELYDYLFRDRADVLKSIQNVPAQYQEQKKAIKTKQIEEFFFAEEEPLIAVDKDERASFRSLLRSINATKLEEILYGNVTDETPEYKFSYDDEKIAACLKQYDDQFHFFASQNLDKLFNQYKALYCLCRVVRKWVENERTEDAEYDLKRAYKMLVLFGETQSLLTESKASCDLTVNYFKSFDIFMARHNLIDKEHPMHDVFIWALPEYDVKKQRPDLNAWRNIIYTTGRRALRLFGKAAEIEDKLNGRAPVNFTEAFETGKAIIYKQVELDSEFAHLCMHYDVKEEIFNRCLELKKVIKKSDKLPNIIVDSSDEEIDKPGYYLVKLPVNDLRAFILGQITDCCQFIGGHSEQCVIDGISLQNNGFYVLLKEKKKHLTESKSRDKQSPLIEMKDGPSQINYAAFEIIGQGYAWLSHDGNLVIDSWENLRQADNPLIVKMLQQFARKVAHQKDSSIWRVAIGSGGKTPEFFSSGIQVREMMREGSQYGDSITQILIYANSEVQQELITRMQKVIPSFDEDDFIANPSHVYSNEQVARLEKLWQNEEFAAYFGSASNKGEIRIGVMGFENLMGEYSLRTGFRAQFYIFSILAILHDAGINIDKKVEFIYLEERLEVIYELFIKLHRAKLLNQENFELIRKHNNSTYSLTTYGDVLLALNENKEYAFTYSYALDIAISSNNMGMVIKLLESKCVDLNKINPFSTPALPLRQAVKNENIEIISLLIKHGAEITFDTLWDAIKTGRQDILDSLIKNGGDIHQVDAEGATLLISAVQRGSYQMAKYLIDHNVDVNKPNKTGEYPLLFCVRREKIDLTKLLIDHKANANAKTTDNVTPLNYWASNQNLFSEGLVPNLKLLLDAKADINSVDADGIPPIVSVIKNKLYKGNPLSVLLQSKDLVLDKAVLLNVKFYKIADGDSKASCMAYARTLVILNEAKLINSETATRLGEMSLSFDDLPDALEILAEAKLLNAENLHILLSGGYGTKYSNVSNVYMVHLIIAFHSGDDLSSVDFTKTLFNILKCTPRDGIIVPKIISTQKIDINAHDHEGQSLLNVALSKDANYDLIELLLHAKANVMEKNKEGWFPLHYAACMKSSNLAALLLEHKADLESKNATDITPIMMAVASENVEVTKFLIKSNVNVNATTEQGKSSLHIAIASNASRYVKLLMNAKADVNMKDYKDRTLLEMKMSDEIRAILQFKHITPKELIWLKRQISQLDESLLQKLEALLESKEAPTTMFYQVVRVLQEKLNASLQNPVSPGSVRTAGTLFSTKTEDHVTGLLYAILQEIEKNLCRSPLGLPVANIKPVEIELLQHPLKEQLIGLWNFL